MIKKEMKIYQSPKIEVVKVEGQTILAGSPNLKGNTEDVEDVPGNW